MVEKNQSAEKSEAKENNVEPKVSAREALTQAAMDASRSAGSATGRDASSSSAATSDTLPRLQFHDGGGKSGIVTTYDENGNATSDCNGPIPRHPKFDPAGQKGGEGHVFDANTQKGGEAHSKLDPLTQQKGGENHSLDIKPGENPQLKTPEELGKLLNPGEKFGEKHLDDLFKHLNDSVEKLPTGDYLVRDGGKETLFTPNGDSVTVNPDGSHTIKGDVSKVTTDKDGVTKVEFKDGATVTLDEEGIRGVNRGNQGVMFGRNAVFGGGGFKPPIAIHPDDPWDGKPHGGGGVWEAKPMANPKDQIPWSKK